MKVLAANRSDLEGAKQMLAPLNGLFPRLRHVWGDSHYGGSLVGWLREHLGWTVEAVRPPKPPSLQGLTVSQILQQWEQLFPPPSRLRGQRWVVKRTIAWIVGLRRLARDHEGLPQTSEACITIAMSRLMFTRLVPFFPERFATKHSLSERMIEVAPSGRSLHLRPASSGADDLPRPLFRLFVE